MSQPLDIMPPVETPVALAAAEAEAKRKAAAAPDREKILFIRYELDRLPILEINNVEARRMVAEALLITTLKLTTIAESL